jgi:hypothetical protein
MPVAIVIEAPGMTADVYNRALEELDWDDNVPEGFLSHTACVTPEGIFVFDVWESAEQFGRFAETRLGPAIAAATDGQAPPVEPRIYPIHRQA